MFYITKQEGLYQNKVNFSLVFTCNCKMSYCKLGWLQLKEIVHLECLRCCNGKIKDKKEKLGFKPQTTTSQQSEFFEVQCKLGLRLFFSFSGVVVFICAFSFTDQRCESR